MTTTEKLLPAVIYISGEYGDEDRHGEWRAVKYDGDVKYIRADLTPVSAEDLHKVRDALNDAHEFIECDKTHKHGEIREYAKRVCNTLEEVRPILDRIAKAVG